MKISFKAKSIIKKIALALAGVATITGISFGIKAIVDYTKNDLKTILPSFEVGNLGSDGKYVDDESTLYTKDAFACKGLQVKLDFDNQINYQIFYYDDLDNFVESTAILSAAYSESRHDGYARLVIVPKDDEDGKISFKEKVTYPKQMTVKVSKNAKVEYHSVFGKRLQVIDDISFCRFSYGGVSNIGGEYKFDSTLGNGQYAVTSSDLLSVKRGSTITVDYTNVGVIGKVAVYRFRKTADGLAFITDSGPVTSLKLDNDCDFIVLVFYTYGSEEDHYIDIPESMLPLVNQYITITK